MRMTMWLGAVLAVGMLMPGQSVAQSGRPGVIEQMEPIENKGADESALTQRARGIGRSLGQMGGFLASKAVIESDAGDNRYVRNAAQGVASSNTGANLGGDLGARVVGPGESVQYMVKVRLDSGRVLSVPQMRSELGRLKTGDRVLVEGRGNNARVLPAQ